MWSVLATKRPADGICVVAVEACLAYRLGQIPYPNSNADVLTMAFVATQAMSVVISLLVVRSWGYRLMPMPSCVPGGGVSQVNTPAMQKVFVTLAGMSPSRGVRLAGWNHHAWRRRSSS